MTQALTYVELDAPICSLTYGVAPCTAGSLAVAGDAGTAIGNLTSGAGIDSAFTGGGHKTAASSAFLADSTADGTIGKDWGAGESKVIRSAAVQGPSNIAIYRNSSNVNTSATIKLQGSNDGSAWTDLDSDVTGTGTSTTVTLTYAGSTAYRFHRVIIVAAGSSDKTVSSVDFVEAIIDLKCFNTKVTCQDPDNYDEITQTLRFAVGADFYPRDIEYVAKIKSVDFTPGSVSFAGTLGERSLLKVVLQDAPHSDTGPGFDKYHAERSYNPWEQGTLFGKFRARQPYLQGKFIRWINGFVGQDIADMETRYFVDEFNDGPNEDLEFAIVAKDPLKLLDSDRAQAPFLSGGYLASDIDDNDTAVSLLPLGIGNQQYPSSGYACIGGNEIVFYTRGNNVLNPIDRAKLGTTASAHSTLDRFQQVLRYTGVDPADILYDLLTTYAGISPSFIDRPSWQLETASFLGVLATVVLPEPTPVKQLVEEILEQFGLAMWWDDVSQKIRLMVIREVDAGARVYSENDRIGGTLQIVDQPELRLTRVQVNYGQKDPTKSLDEVDNYRSVKETVADTAEESLPVVIKQVKARWIIDETQAATLGSILLSRFQEAPRRISFRVMRREGEAVPKLGDGIKISGPQFQDEFGARVDVPIQITRIDPTSADIGIEAVEMLFNGAVGADVDDHVKVISSPVNNYNLRTQHDLTYPPATAGQTVRCIINSGVTVGSIATNRPAFDVGSWPAGVTIILTVNGRIQGKGGTGGKGGFYVDGPASGDVETIASTVGLVGGPALKTREVLTINGTGEIWGGGGGGGGGGADITAAVSQESTGGGGGGGQGTLPGAGGPRRADGNPGATGTANAPGSGGAGKRNGHPGGTAGTEGVAGSTGNGSGGHDWDTGAAGGAAGAAIDGDSFVTEAGSLDIKVSRIN